MYLLYYPAAAHLGIYPRKMKTYIHTKTCTQSFTVALFVIAPNWKQAKCPSADEWLNKLQYTAPWNPIQQ